MSQTTFLENQHVAWIGRESTHGTTASTMIRIAMSGAQQPLGSLVTQTLQSKDLGLYRHDPNPLTSELQLGAPIKLTVGIKAFPSKLNASATPAGPSSASALSHTVLLDHWMGGTHVAAGSTVAASPAPAVGGCTVASGHGSRFVVGQVAIINGEPVVIGSVSTDAITWSPDLPSAPSAGDIVYNTYSFHRAEAQTQSLTLATAYYETGTPVDQRRARGVVGQCAWAAEMGQHGTLAFDGQVTSFDVGDLSLSVTEVSDDMGATIRWDGAAYLFAASSTTAPTHVCVRSVKVTVPNKWSWIRCGSDENTVSSAVAVGGREDPIMVECVLRFDADYYTGFNAGTLYRGFFYTRQGSGTSQRLVGWHFPTLSIDGTPVESAQDGIIFVTVKFRALQSTITSGSDIARSPAVLFAG